MKNKNIYSKSTANIYSVLKHKTFSPWSGTRQECPQSPLSFNIALEVLTSPIRQEKEKASE